MAPALRVLQRLVVVTGILILARSPGLGGHPFSLSWLSLDVGADKIHARIEILLEDVVLFHGFEPNAEQHLGRNDLLYGLELHQDLLLSDLELVGVDGNALAGHVVSMSPPDLPAEGLGVWALMNHSAFYELEYDIGRVPEALTIVQRFGGEAAGVPALLELTVSRRGEPAIGPLILEHGSPRTLRWSASTPFCVEVTPRISLTGDESGLEQEFLIPLPCLEPWLPEDREKKAFLNSREQRIMADRFRALLSAHNHLEVQGRPTTPNVRVIEFLDALEVSRPRVSVWNGLLRARLYLEGKFVGRMGSVHWTLYTDRLKRMLTTYRGIGETLTRELTTGDDALEWGSGGKGSRVSHRESSREGRR